MRAHNTKGDNQRPSHKTHSMSDREIVETIRQMLKDWDKAQQAKTAKRSS